MKAWIKAAAGLLVLMLVVAIGALFVLRTRGGREASLIQETAVTGGAAARGQDKAAFAAPLPAAGAGAPADLLEEDQKQALERALAGSANLQGASAGALRAATTDVQRYPLIDAPDRVRVGQEFAVEVSLTEQQIATSTRIVGGRATPEGRLAMQLPALADNWKIDVVLSATGFDFTRANNTGSFVLPRTGDSTPAVFHLRASAIDGDKRTAPIRATLWHNGAYLGRIQRDVVVLASAGADTGVTPAVEVGGARTPPTPADQSGSRNTTRAAASIEIDPAFETPDLTIYILDRTDDAARSKTEIIVNSPHLQPARYEVARVPGRREWIAAQLATLAQRGRGLDVPKAAPTPNAADFARGFGRQLYRDCAPAAFKEAFWGLVNRLGDRFRTIQIITDDPSFPWELLRPTRPDGGGERDFLGLEFGVARWHVGTDAPQLQRPPQEVRLERLTVVAPHYRGPEALHGQATEVAALKQLPGFASVAGRVAGLRELFRHPPAGIIHFSGHGSVRENAVGATFAIRLEDGDLDVMSWRGMVAPGQAEHPFVFFNACDVGNAQATAGLIEGWAPALLSTGASGYIGALWAVNDRRAAEFAAEFYAHVNRDLQNGPSRPGRVLADTRRSLFARTGDPTALAYVLYGDPLLRFTRRGGHE